MNWRVLESPPCNEFLIRTCSTARSEGPMKTFVLALILAAMASMSSPAQADWGKRLAIGGAGLVLSRAVASCARSSECQQFAARKATEFGVRGFQACLRHPGCSASVVGAMAGIAAQALPHEDADRRRAQLVEPRRLVEQGLTPEPPGFCPEERFYSLNSAVQRHCKETILESCGPEDSIFSARLKARSFRLCIMARKEREEICFRGGDRGHREQIASLMNGFNRCLTRSGGL